MGKCPTFEQRLTFITLGVSDLDRARKFYGDTLGFKHHTDNDQIIFYDLGGFMLGLYAHDKLAEDMDAPEGDGYKQPYHGMALAYNARTKADVDKLFAELKAADVTILKEPHKAFWGGYSGYFADPDGHPWEVAFNPHLPLNETGHVA
jgi:hypothetical protein